jgi:hypothetical protein
MKEPIFITGASRSGSSMIAGILNLCGVFGGTGNIERGMFENSHIRKNIVDPYFNKIGADINGQYPLPDIQQLNIPVDWREKVLKSIKKDGAANTQWFYKSPKLCLIWPVWAYAFPNAKWIIVRRRDEDIVHSCLNTMYMNVFDSVENQKAVNAKDKSDAWYWWVRQHNRRFVEMIEAGLNCKQVHPERMVNGDYSQIYEMLDWLGLKWDSKIPEYIEPKFFKVRNK